MSVCPFMAWAWSPSHCLPALHISHPQVKSEKINSCCPTCSDSDLEQRSSKLAPQSVLVHLTHQERQAEANSKLARALMALPGQPATGALNLLLVQSKASSGVAASRWLTRRLSSCLPVVCWRITYQFPMEWESLERSFPNLVWKYSLEPCNWSLVWA